MLMQILVKGGILVRVLEKGISMSAEKMVVPRRSLRYVPGANARTLEKAQAIDCDTVIFDLEDAVASAAKIQAREQVGAALARYQYGYREFVVRCNALETE